MQIPVYLIVIAIVALLVICYLLVRAAVIEEIGYLDEAFFCYGEETDWCRRCSEAGWRLQFAPVGEITHFGSGSTSSASSRTPPFNSSDAML